MQTDLACCMSCSVSPGHQWTTIARMGGIATSPNGRRETLTHLQLCEIANAFCSGANQNAPVSLKGETELSGASVSVRGAPACAWVRGLRVLKGELQAQISWLPEGKKLLASGHQYLTPMIRFDSRASEGPKAGQLIGCKLSSIALSKIPDVGAQRVTMKSSEQTKNKELPMFTENQSAIADRLLKDSPDLYRHDPARLASDAFVEFQKGRVGQRDGVGAALHRQFPGFKMSDVIDQQLLDRGVAPPPPGSTREAFEKYNSAAWEAGRGATIAATVMADRVAPEAGFPASYLDSQNRIIKPATEAAQKAKESSRLAMGDLVDAGLKEGLSLSAATSRAYAIVAAGQLGASANTIDVQAAVDAGARRHGPDMKPSFSPTLTPTGDNEIAIKFSKPIDAASLRRLQALLLEGNF